MTFERWATALRRACSRRRRSAPPTSASGSSSWPTPDATASNDGEAPETWLQRRAALKAKGINGNGCGTPLAMAVQLWPTPQSRDHRDGRIGAETAAANARPLNEFAVTMWATPAATDANRGHTMPEGAKTRKKGKPKILNYGVVEFMDALPSPPGPPTSPDGGRSSKVTRTLNPRFVEWLMGWPIGWTACAVSATEWSRWRRLMRGSLSRLHSGRIDEAS